MAKCAECGAQMKDGEECPACAAQAELATPGPEKTHFYDSVCGACGALLPAGQGTCLICATPRDAVPFRGNFPVENPDSAAFPHPEPPNGGAARKTPDVWRRWMAGMTSLVLLMFAGLSGFGIYREYFDTSSYRALESLVYEAADGYYLTHPELEAPRRVEGLDPGGTILAARPSPNGRWLACTDDRGGLYVLDLARRLGEEDAYQLESIATGLSQPGEFSQNSEYLVYLNRQGELFASDLSESWQLDTGVVEVASVDERRVLYTRRGDHPEQLDLYVDLLAKDSGQRNVIDRNITQVLDYTPGFERILYTGVRTGEDGGEVSSLQLFEQSQGTTVTLVSAVGDVLDASAEKAAVIYLDPKKLDWDYRSFIYDDYIMRDAVLREPELEKYPLVERIYDQLDDEGALEDNDDEELLEEIARYRNAVKRWEDKLYRDELREIYRKKAKETEGALELGDLYSYQNGALALMDSDVVLRTGEDGYTDSFSAQEGYAVYEKVDLETLERTTLSTVGPEDDVSSFSPVDYFLASQDRELRFSTLGGRPRSLYIQTEASTFSQWRVTRSGDGIYFMAGAVTQSASGSALYYAPVRGGEPGEASLVERNVSSIRAAFRDGAVFDATQQGAHRLWFAQAGQARSLSGAGDQPIDIQPGALLYYGGEADGEESTLYLLSRDEHRISDNVILYVYRSDDLLYLLKDDEGTGAQNLYLWQAGREQLLAGNVLGAVQDGI